MSLRGATIVSDEAISNEAGMAFRKALSIKREIATPPKDGGSQ